MCDKKCPRCSCVKDVSLFPKQGGWCKTCNAESQKLFRQQNKERLAAKRKEYVAKNAAKVKDLAKKSRERHKDAISKLNKQYRLKHADSIKSREQEYKKTNAVDIAAKAKLRLQNKSPEQKAEMNARRNAREKERISCDPEFKLKKRVRARISQALKSDTGMQGKRTIELLGCRLEDFKIYIENKFCDGMTWDNYGKWVLDHELPCAMFNLRLRCEQEKCFHFTNLQPMWEKDNLKKSDKVSHEDATLTAMYLLFEE